MTEDRRPDRRTVLKAAMGKTGLPMGIQIIAPAHHERACLELAAAYEAADPWWLKQLPPQLG